MIRGVLPDAWFERMDGIPLSKAPLRGAVLGLLSPLEGATVLEVGAGSGGATVEFARHVGTSGKVWSLECDLRALELARRNVSRTENGSRVTFVQGKAPESLPRGEWDAVFVGGHGGDLEEILHACWQCLCPGGRLLLTSILLDSAQTALHVLESLGGHPESWIISSGTGRPMGGSWAFTGHNPVFLIWGDRRA